MVGAFYDRFGHGNYFSVIHPARGKGRHWMGLLCLHDSLFRRHRASIVHPVNALLTISCNLPLGFCRAGIRLYGTIQRWNINESSPQLTYYIDPTASGITSLIQQAESDWSSVSTSMRSWSRSPPRRPPNHFQCGNHPGLGRCIRFGVWSTTSAGTPLCTASILSSTATDRRPTRPFFMKRDIAWALPLGGLGRHHELPARLRSLERRPVRGDSALSKRFVDGLSVGLRQRAFQREIRTGVWDSVFSFVFTLFLFVGLSRFGQHLWRRRCEKQKRRECA